MRAMMDDRVDTVTDGVEIEQKVQICINRKPSKKKKHAKELFSNNSRSGMTKYYYALIKGLMRKKMKGSVDVYELLERPSSQRSD